MERYSSGLSREQIVTLIDRNALELMTDGYVQKDRKNWRIVLSYTCDVKTADGMKRKQFKVAHITDVPCFPDKKDPKTGEIIKANNRNREAALKELAKWRAAIAFDVQTVSGQTTSAIKTVPEYVTDYIDQRASRNAIEDSTVSSYRQSARYISMGGIENKYINLLKYADVNRWITNLTASYAPVTIVKAYRLLSMVCDEAVRRGDIDKNPCQGVELPKQAKDEKPNVLDVARVSETEGEQISIAKLYHLLVGEYNSDQGSKVLAVSGLLALFGGMRESEIAGLAWGDCSFQTDQKQNIIGVTLKLSHAVGRTAEGCYLKGMKSKAGKRVIVLPGFVAEILWSKRAEMQEEALRLGAPTIDALFVVGTTVPNRPRTHSDKARYFSDPHYISIQWSNFAKAHDIRGTSGGYLDFHGLRRSFSTIAAGANINNWQLTAAMGQSDVKVTADHYVNTDPLVLQGWHMINAASEAAIAEADVLTLKPTGTEGK